MVKRRADGEGGLYMDGQGRWTAATTMSRRSRRSQAWTAWPDDAAITAANSLSKSGCVR